MICIDFHTIPISLKVARLFIAIKNLQHLLRHILRRVRRHQSQTTVDVCQCAFTTTLKQPTLQTALLGHLLNNK